MRVIPVAAYVTNVSNVFEKDLDAMNKVINEYYTKTKYERLNMVTESRGRGIKNERCIWRNESESVTRNLMAPDPKVSTEFWNKLWSEPVEHN